MSYNIDGTSDYSANTSASSYSHNYHGLHSSSSSASFPLEASLGDIPAHIRGAPLHQVEMFLGVPYGEREEAKLLGARWDAGRKLWFIPRALRASSAKLFSKWLPPLVKELIEDCGKVRPVGPVNFAESDFICVQYYDRFHPIPAEEKFAIAKKHYDRFCATLERLKREIAETVSARPVVIHPWDFSSHTPKEFQDSPIGQGLSSADVMLRELLSSLISAGAMLKISTFWDADRYKSVQIFCDLVSANERMMRCLDLPELLRIAAEKTPDHVWTSYEQAGYKQIYDQYGAAHFATALGVIDEATGLPSAVVDIAGSFLWNDVVGKRPEGGGAPMVVENKSKKRKREEEDEEKGDQSECWFGYRCIYGGRGEKCHREHRRLSEMTPIDLTEYKDITPAKRPKTQDESNKALLCAVNSACGEEVYRSVCRDCSQEVYYDPSKTGAPPPHYTALCMGCGGNDVRVPQSVERASSSSSSQ